MHHILEMLSYRQSFVLFEIPIKYAAINLSDDFFSKSREIFRKESEKAGLLKILKNREFLLIKMIKNTQN